MDKLEKIDRLRERADVSYEEAKEALEQAGDDLLDAMVLLEKAGKVKQPQQSSYSTSYEEQKQYICVVDKVEEQKKNAPSFGNSIGKIVRAILQFVLHSSFHITRRGNNLFTLPTWLMVILVGMFWKVAIPIAVVVMIFGVRYSFESDGRVDNQTANDTANELLEKAGSIADSIENGLRKDDKR